MLEQLYVLFLQRYDNKSTAAQRAVCDALVAGFDRYLMLVDADERGLFRTEYTGTTLRDHFGYVPQPVAG